MLNISITEPEITSVLRDRASWLCSHITVLKSFIVHLQNERVIAFILSSGDSGFLDLEEEDERG